MKRAEYEKRYKRLEKASALLSLIFSFGALYLFTMYEVDAKGTVLTEKIYRGIARNLPNLGSWPRATLMLILPLAATSSVWWLSLKGLEKWFGLRCPHCGRSLALSFSTRFLLSTGTCIGCFARVLEDTTEDADESQE